MNNFFFKTLIMFIKYYNFFIHRKNKNIRFFELKIMRVMGLEPIATVWKTVNLTINRYSQSYNYL